jgi:hypothetical protein
MNRAEQEDDPMTEPISVTVSSGVAISAKSTSKTPRDHVAVFNLAVCGSLPPPLRLSDPLFSSIFVLILA